MKYTKRLGLIGLVVASIAAAVVSASAALTTRPTAARCGGQTWHMSTLSDAQRRAVALTPKTTTIGALTGRDAPRRQPGRRSTSFQRQTWQVIAQVTGYRLNASVLELTLFDAGGYMKATLPAPSCLPSTTRARTQIIKTWTKFVNDCGHPADHSQPLGAVGYISGVGFWGRAHAGAGLAPNGAQLSPVTGLRFVAGCKS
jgi:hypothetical protein